MITAWCNSKLLVSSASQSYCCDFLISDSCELIAQCVCEVCKALTNAWLVSWSATRPSLDFLPTLQPPARRSNSRTWRSLGWVTQVCSSDVDSVDDRLWRHPRSDGRLKICLSIAGWSLVFHWTDLRTAILVKSHHPSWSTAAIFHSFRWLSLDGISVGAQMLSDHALSSTSCRRWGWGLGLCSFSYG